MMKDEVVGVGKIVFLVVATGITSLCLNLHRIGVVGVVEDIGIEHERWSLDVVVVGIGVGMGERNLGLGLVRLLLLRLLHDDDDDALNLEPEGFDDVVDDDADAVAVAVADDEDPDSDPCCVFFPLPAFNEAAPPHFFLLPCCSC